MPQINITVATDDRSSLLWWQESMTFLYLAKVKQKILYDTVIKTIVFYIAHSRPAILFKCYAIRKGSLCAPRWRPFCCHLILFQHMLFQVISKECLMVQDTEILFTSSVFVICHSFWILVRQDEVKACTPRCCWSIVISKHLLQYVYPEDRENRVNCIAYEISLSM